MHFKKDNETHRQTIKRLQPHNCSHEILILTNKFAHSPTFSLLFYRTSAQNIQRKSDITELDVSKRCKDLASFMENLLQETRTPGLGKDVLATDDRSFSVTISYVLVSPTLTYFANNTL